MNALQTALMEEALANVYLPKDYKSKSKKPVGPKLPRSALLAIDEAHSDEIHGSAAADVAAA